MFTGLVEETGSVLERSGLLVRFGVERVLEGMKVGDSVAVNGCCLTVVAFQEPAGGREGWWEAELSQETLMRTTLGDLEVGSTVNLERPLRLGDRLGGHIVQGHVDGVAEVVAGVPEMEVAVPSHLGRYLVEKGSVAVDGVSLTIARLTESTFSVAVIGHTSDVTNLGGKQQGDRVNLEVDVLAKHVERLLGSRKTVTAGNEAHEQESP